MVRCVMKISASGGTVAFEPPEAESPALDCIKTELRRCIERHGGFALVTIQPPKKPRTTGEGSQNHHLNGHVMQICNETGNDYDTVKDAVKMLAAENMGYPCKTLAGHVVPQRETECGTDECALLIEAAHVLAFELGIVLREG